MALVGQEAWFIEISIRLSVLVRQVEVFSAESSHLLTCLELFSAFQETLTLNLSLL